jgi:hypothetical protein
LAVVETDDTLWPSLTAFKHCTKETSHMKKVMAGLAVVSVLAAPTALVVGPAEAAGAKTFQNCTALNKAYPHGVGLPNAKDKTSGTPVTAFKRSKPLYDANRKSDRDRDGVACEKA